MMGLFEAVISAASAVVVALIAYIVHKESRTSEQIQINARLIDAWFALNKFEIESGFAARHRGLISGDHLDSKKLTKQDIAFIHCYFDVVLLHFLYARDYSLDNDILVNVLVEHLHKMRAKRDILLPLLSNDNFPGAFVRYLDKIWGSESFSAACEIYRSIKKFDKPRIR